MGIRAEIFEGAIGVWAATESYDLSSASFSVTTPSPPHPTEAYNLSTLVSLESPSAVDEMDCSVVAMGKGLLRIADMSR